MEGAGVPMRTAPIRSGVAPMRSIEVVRVVGGAPLGSHGGWQLDLALYLHPHNQDLAVTARTLLTRTMALARLTTSSLARVS